MKSLYSHPISGMLLSWGSEGLAPNSNLTASDCEEGTTPLLLPRIVHPQVSTTSQLTRGEGAKEGQTLAHQLKF